MPLPELLGQIRERAKTANCPFAVIGLLAEPAPGVVLMKSTRTHVTYAITSLADYEFLIRMYRRCVPCQDQAAREAAKPPIDPLAP